MTIPDVAVEIVTWRISAFGRAPHVRLAVRADGAAPAPKGTRLVRFSRHRAPVETPVYDRMQLGVGSHIDGPALLEERETTAVLRPGWSATVDDHGSVIAVPSTAA
jgi:N-methylhydantoinase A